MIKSSMMKPWKAGWRSSCGVSSCRKWMEGGKKCGTLNRWQSLSWLTLGFFFLFASCPTLLCLCLFLFPLVAEEEAALPFFLYTFPGRPRQWDNTEYTQRIREGGGFLFSFGLGWKKRRSNKPILGINMAVWETGPWLPIPESLYLYL